MKPRLTPANTEIEFDDLVCQITAQFENGEKLQLADYQREHPQFAKRLERLWPTLQAVAGLGHFQDALPLPTAPEVRRGTLGDFEIIREIGRGGMGVVYEAEQISLSRRVALKVLPFAAVLDATQLQRFKNEAQIAAHLTHQHIVPVYAVGCERSVHFYAMQYIEGRTLADVLLGQSRPAQEKTELGEPTVNVGKQSVVATEHNSTGDGRNALIGTHSHAQDSTLGTSHSRDYYDTIARLTIQAAEALQYAHRKDVVHRDIKPSNLILDYEGNLWVADFGLAFISAGQSLTMTGDLVGTVRYMSPEQAAGDRAELDHRTDIYSLGVTLYELLVGQPAFVDNDRHALFRSIAEREPPTPRSVQVKIPVDLETIVLKAICKDPIDRYDSMAELAADLQRYLDDRPILARRASLAERARRWCRRNPLVVMLAISVLLLVAVTGLSIAKWAQLPVVFSRAESLSLREVASNVSDLGDISPDGRRLTRTNWETGNMALLDLISGEQHDVTSDGSWREGNAEYNELSVWSPDGNQLAYQWILPNAFELRTISRDGTKRRTLMRKEKLRYLHPFSWSADGHYILVGQQYGYEKVDLTLVDVADGSETVVHSLSEPRPDSAQLSPSGRYVAWDHRTSDSSERDIFVLDVHTKKVVRVEENPANDMFPEWTPDGKWLLFTSDRRGGRGLWAVRWMNGRPLGQVKLVSELSGPITPLGVTREGSYFFARATVDRDLFQTRIDIKNGVVVGEVNRLPTSLQGVNLVGAYSPDGKRIAWLSTPESGREMAVLSVRDLSNHETREFPIRTLLNGVFVGGNSLQWLPTGEAVIIRGSNGSGTHYFRVDTENGRIARYLPDLFDPIGDLYAFSSDGRHVYFVELRDLERKEPGIYRLDIASGNKVRLHPLFGRKRIISFGVSPNGKQIAFCTENVMYLLPTAGGEAQIIYEAPDDQQLALSLVWASNDSVLAGLTPRGGQTTALWQFFADRRPARPMGLTSRQLQTLRLHPNGRELLYASGTGNSQFKVWSLDNVIAHLSRSN